VPKSVIQCEGLGKSYLIGHQGTRESYTALRDVVARQVRGVWQATRRALRGQSAVAGDEIEEFWALRDVSFEVNQGEVVGIIGRNGAGKSTLLKILSRITEPTEGRVTLRGRVASLLEVGTGFHPELTGRENIFLNGAILGMTRAEIKRKFDEIVAFAEVEKFLDTPVKRFSSGMYVRLAFAVAAHLEPEILLVDEVLAVGDVEFQKKCLGKMQDVSRGGRTVLFVSHNMAAIEALCNRVIYVEQGQIAADGPGTSPIRDYLASGRSTSNGWKPFRRNRGRTIEILGAELIVNGAPSSHVCSGEPCTIRIKYRTIDPERIGSSLSVSLLLYANGQKLSNLWTECSHTKIELRPAGVIECKIERWPFRGSQFRIDVYTHCGPVIEEWLEECLVFDSMDGDYFGTGTITHSDQGIMFMNHEWSANAS
jgi:homopolymeric O-antigen transport system ATP-binding protein